MDMTVLQRRIAIDESLIDASRAMIREQLQDYSSGECKEFELHVSTPDSFTGQVMDALQNLGYGETATYGEIGDRLDTAPVAVGQACARNPVPIIVPCHRVVAEEGLGGYQYPGLKERLLRHEGAL
ncbi:MAG: methylated-DNA--[protein]-cysteine S-methyltransferase [Candidatus Nanohaloarchaea archaeon]|nr:methylated-DNA--[protein]-cysteine S-methyltransferase [Candidatus Nanohaloarchaea archaeon]